MSRCRLLGLIRVALASMHLLLAGVASAGEKAENLALGKKVTLQPAPNYSLCTDPDDGIQLTDGKTTTAYFWTQKGTVGWSGVAYAAVTVDLGAVHPIGGVAMTTAAGVAGVTWPASVHILTSDDGKVYLDAGDLITLDRKRAEPWPSGYAIRRLQTAEIATRGRFVQFVIIPPAGGPYLFTDEVEVFRGPDSLLQKEPAGKPVAGAESLFVHWRTRSSIQHRFEADASGVEKAIRAAELSDADRQSLLDRLSQVRQELRPEAIEVDAGFRAELPLNDAHGRLFGVQAALWRAMGHPALSAWADSPWAPLDPMAAPSRESTKSVEIHAMLGEHRAGAITLANASEKPIEVKVQCEGLPGSPCPSCLDVQEVAWTDTGRGIPVAAALPPARKTADGWLVRVPPGLVRQVWLAFHIDGLSPGLHEGRVVLSAPAVASQAIPVRLQVYPLQLPAKTSLWVGGWDYSNGPGRYGITPDNRQAFLKHLHERCVNVPWATASAVMKFQFDAAGRVALDTQEFDRWIGDWPEARAYLVFLGMGDYSEAAKPQFAGARIGTPEFDQRVGAWISAWVAHLRQKGIDPKRFGLLIHDEPHEGSDVSMLVAFARAVRKAEPKVLIWEDPTYQKPQSAPAELFDVCHVLCPNRPMWLAEGKSFEDFFVEQTRRGKALHMYSCSGPARLLDPYAYYRLQSWHCMRYGGIGSFFWAFGDNSGASSWNEYLAKAGPFTPLFLDEKTVVAGKQMEAVRESAEDYETFVMLRAAVAAAKSAGQTDAALMAGERLLAEAPAIVLDAEGARGVNWHDPKDREIADRIRVQLLRAIVTLNKAGDGRSE